MDKIRVVREGPVRTVTLDRPEARNALDNNMLEGPAIVQYREMRIRRIGEGPSEVQRVIVARDLLGRAMRG